MDYNYNFSIIIAAYNTQGYLKEAVDSLINQNIGFRKNVEIIIVDDGSLDNTYGIAQEYAKKYPDNIKAFTKKHNGIASARNTGLKHATGKYINFLDSDDYLSSNTLNVVFEFFEENYDEIDIISIPMFFFDESNAAHPLNYKYNKTTIIDLENYPNNPQISISSSFIKNKIIKGQEFKENLIISEDTLLLNKILLNKKTLGVIKNAKYFYRKRFSSTSTTASSIFKKEYYVPRLKEYFLDLINYSIKKTGKVEYFIQYTIIYDLQKILKQENLDIDEIEDNENEFYALLRKIISKLDNKVILSNKNIKNKFLVNYIYYLKRNDLHPEYIENKDVKLRIDKRLVDTLSVHKFWITNVSIVNRKMIIEGDFVSYFNSNHLSIEAIVTNGEENHSYYASLTTDLDNSRKFMSKVWQYKTLFKIEIPLNENSKETHLNDIKLMINYHKNQDNTDFSEENIISTKLAIDFKEKATNFKNNENYVQDKYLVSFKNQQFHTSEFKYKFSVVMAVYNTEDYLREAINSVIYQTLDFKENIELIIVNDGSTDSSEDIALEYQEKYPDNIIVLTQENQGQASARNNGIEHAHGRYINFLDSDDYLSENAFEKVSSFFEEHSGKCDVVSLPLMQFGRFEGEHGLNYKFETTRMIDLTEEPDNPQLHVSSSFIESNILKKYRFDTRLISSEDANILNKALLNKNKLGVISDACYYYRRRSDNSSTIDTMTKRKEHYTPRLKYHFMELIDFCITNFGKVPRFIQYTLLYDLHWLIYETDDLNLVFDNEYEIEEFNYYINNIMKYIDTRVILNNCNVTNSLLRKFLLILKDDDTNYLIKNDTVLFRRKNIVLDNLKNHHIYLDIVNIDDNTLYLSGQLTSLFDNKLISIQAVKYKDNIAHEDNENIENIINEEDKEYFEAKYVKYTSRKDRCFISKKWQYKYNFDIQIPLEDNESSNIYLVVNYHIDGNSDNYNKEDIVRIKMDVSFKNHARLSEISNYLIHDEHVLTFNDNIFSIRKYSYANLLSLEWNVIKTLFENKPYGYLEAVKIRLLHLILFPYYKNKEIDFFMDRIYVADDNATYLFKYANKQKDNIKKYMLISKESDDYKKLSKIGNVINHNSFKNKLLSLFAKKVISTHPYENQFNPFYDKENDTRPLYAGLFNPKTYFLQHGVTLGNISSWMSKFDHNVSLIATVSDEEKESFYKEGYNYDKSIIQTLGFPRYDELKNNSEKYILIIPTWRKYLRKNREVFVNSDYYEKLNDILSDNSFIEDLMNKGYKIIFKPHPELERNIEDSDEIYTDLFDINPNITVSRDETYNRLFEKSSILITDYSSVFFDFAYLKKPIIYYQPFDDYHYDESYFDFETMGFGEVVYDKTNLITRIEKYLDNNCIMEDEYKERVDSFFKYTDKNNCKRVYDWIKEH